MIRKGWAAVPLPEGRGPPCKGPDCYTRNGPCHPGCTPEARAVQHAPVPTPSEQVECTNGSPGPQWRDRLRCFVGWVLQVASLVAASRTIADGIHALIDLISKLT